MLSDLFYYILFQVILVILRDYLTSLFSIEILYIVIQTTNSNDSQFNSSLTHADQGHQSFHKTIFIPHLVLAMYYLSENVLRLRSLLVVRYPKVLEDLC